MKTTAQSNIASGGFDQFQPGELLRGAREHAVFLFNDEKRFREVYPLVGILPISTIGRVDLPRGKGPSGRPS